jgi:hypothetical protein
MQMELGLGKPKMEWGGRREGAGRKKTSKHMPHVARPFHDKNHPVHVTMRVVRGLLSLRTHRVARKIGNAIRRVHTGRGFRVIHFSIQKDHLHFIVEGAGRRTLALGIRGLAIRLAHTINKELNRGGQLFAERYHARPLTTPKEVRIAIICILANFKHHVDDPDKIDPNSSGRWFHGWTTPPPPQDTASPVAHPRTWLATKGWLRHGRIRLSERPK